MGLQNFKFTTDFMNNLEEPILFVAKKDKKILSTIGIYEDLKLDFNLNAFQTLSFTIPEEVDGEIQESYDMLQEGRLIMIQGIGWYEIHVDERNDGNGWVKSVSGTSLEIMLSKRNLVDFEVNAGDILYEEDFTPTKFYNPANKEVSLLNRILSNCPNWSVGHVDSELEDMQRTFDISSQDVYSFLVNDVSEAFDCFFIFDTFNMTVNAYKTKEYGKNANIFVSMDNLVNNMEVTIDENSIFTCYRVYGGEGVYINEVNPNGTNKIYNFEYYLPQMSQGLQDAIKRYNSKYNSLITGYTQLMGKISKCLEEITELKNRVPSLLTSENWDEYGVAMLQIRYDSYSNNDKIYQTMGYNKSDSIMYSLYTKNKSLLDSSLTALNQRKAEVEQKEKELEQLKTQRNNYQSQLDMNKFFTEEQWKELDCYVAEETYENDNFFITKYDDDEERFKIENQLLDKAVEDLNKKCRPQYQYKAELYNMLVMPEFKEFLEYFELGNFIQMKTNYNTLVRLRLINFSVDYSSTEKISVTFSDAIRVKDVYEDMASIQAQANSAAMSFKFNKAQYDKTVNEGNYVAELRKYGLDVAKTKITNANNQSQTWDKTGMLFREFNEQKNDYEPEQMKIINNLLCITDDNWKTVKLALGKIPVNNNDYMYGFSSELLIGKLVMSEYLHLENESGTYKFDGKGFSATSGNNTIKINPSNNSELFSIYKGTDKQVYINNNGDVEFAGSLKIGNGVFSVDTGGNVKITKGSINLGNGAFVVNPDGSIEANKGSFRGSIYCTDGTIGGWTIGDNRIYSNDGIYYAELNPGYLDLYDINNRNNYFRARANIVGFVKDGYYTTRETSFMTPTTISSKDYHGQYMELTKSLILRGNLTLDKYDYRCGGNVYYCNGGYEDSAIPSVGYIDGWCSSNFANKEHNHDGIYAKVAHWHDGIYANYNHSHYDEYAPKEHRHGYYTTESEVRGIIEDMVKSTALR